MLQKRQHHQGSWKTTSASGGLCTWNPLRVRQHRIKVETRTLRCTGRNLVIDRFCDESLVSSQDFFVDCCCGCGQTVPKKGFFCCWWEKEGEHRSQRYQIVFGGLVCHSSQLWNSHSHSIPFPELQASEASPLSQIELRLKPSFESCYTQGHQHITKLLLMAEILHHLGFIKPHQ